MNVCALLVTVLVSLVATQVQGSLEPGQVQPFAQLEPVTISEKAAVKFKPQLKLSSTCHPYAAVDSNGYISSGLDPNFHFPTNCGGSDLGSQIYVRSAWHNDVWAIVYAWYFPKTTNDGGGKRNDWEYAIIWINNPSLESPTILGATLNGKDETEKHAPVDEDNVDGTSFKCKFSYNPWVNSAKLTATTSAGGYQDLITWEPLPDVARTGLEGYQNMPLLNGTFDELLTNG